MLVILGHPRADSLCHAIADEYIQGARVAGADVVCIDLRDLRFSRDVERHPMHLQSTEPDIARARSLLEWAEHVVLVYPTWWGTAPALLKGFLDRVLLPGFAFRHAENAFGFEGLLRGRTGHLITTMDTPPLLYRLIYRAPGHNALRRATLNFCGIAPVRVTSFGSVLSSTPALRTQWLAQARREGGALRGARPTGLERFRIKTAAWIAALRLQFYPAAWLAYALGAAAAAGPGVLGSAAFWLGYLVLFALEAATVLVNEIYDFPADRRNRRYGPFNGGSRVLIDQRLTVAELRAGAWLAAGTAAAAAAALVGAMEVPTTSALPFLAVLAVLTIGYTLPPLKLCHRTLGEIDVALTHGPGVLVWGWIVMGQPWTAPAPWLLALPVALASLPSITLSNLPDREADAAVGKWTLAARFGQRRAIEAALAAAAAAGLCALLFSFLGSMREIHGPVIALGALHAGWLIALLRRARGESAVPREMATLMLASLTLVLWFLVPQLIALLSP